LSLQADAFNQTAQEEAQAELLF